MKRATGGDGANGADGADDASGLLSAHNALLDNRVSFGIAPVSCHKFFIHWIRSSQIIPRIYIYTYRSFHEGSKTKHQESSNPPSTIFRTSLLSSLSSWGRCAAGGPAGLRKKAPPETRASLIHHVQLIHTSMECICAYIYIYSFSRYKHNVVCVSHIFACIWHTYLIGFFKKTTTSTSRSAVAAPPAPPTQCWRRW